MREEQQSPLADEQGYAVWLAKEKDWDSLKQAGNALGWQLAALSFGFAPIPRVIDFLPEPKQKDELDNRRRQINRHLKKREYDDGILRRALVGEEQDSGIECYFDVSKFVDWIKSLPTVDTYPNTVQLRMEQIAEHWAVRSVEDESLKQEPLAPTKNQKAGKTRAERSLLQALLGLAVIHYDYIPPGLAGSSKPGDMVDVYERMSDALSAIKLPVSAGIIKQRLLDAVDNLSVDEFNTLRQTVQDQKSQSGKA